VTHQHGPTHRHVMSAGLSAFTISLCKSFVYISINVKGKGKGLDTCYSATYMSQTRDRQRFTISEVAADWHEPMVPQRIMWPSIARTNGQLDPCAVQLADTPSPQSATLGLHPVAVATTHFPSRRG